MGAKFDSTAYVMQSVADRVEGLADDIERHSVMLWHAGELHRATQLGVAASKIRGVLLEELGVAPACSCAGHSHGQGVGAGCACCRRLGPVRA